MPMLHGMSSTASYLLKFQFLASCSVQSLTDHCCADEDAHPAVHSTQEIMRLAHVDYICCGGLFAESRLHQDSYKVSTTPYPPWCFPKARYVHGIPKIVQASQQPLTLEIHDQRCEDSLGSGLQSICNSGGEDFIIWLLDKRAEPC